VLKTEVMLMSLYDRFVEEVRKRDLIAGSNAGRTGSVVITRSTLIGELERETPNPLRHTHPQHFEEKLCQAMRKPREEYEERRREAERFKPRREELLRVVAECEAALQSATAFTSVELVASTHSRLAAARFLLGLLPEDIEPVDDPLFSAEQEKIWNGFVSSLEAWHARLDVELQRLRGTIEERGEPPGSSTDPLLKDLGAVLRAKRDTNNCLLIARKKAPVKRPAPKHEDVAESADAPRRPPPTPRYRRAGGA
jgi:hypothetical protein